MARQAVRIELSAPERKELDRMVSSPSTPQGLATRARIVLLAAEGRRNDDIGQSLGVGKNTVTLWRNRFRWERLAGLKDRPGKGRKRKYGHDQRLKVIAKSCEKPPEAGRWTVRDLAASLADVGVSKSTTFRILKDIDLKPHHVQGWLTSRDINGG